MEMTEYETLNKWYIAIFKVETWLKIFTKTDQHSAVLYIYTKIIQ